MEVRDIVELINLASARDLSELEVELQGVRLRVVRNGAGALRLAADATSAVTVHSVAATESAVEPGAAAAASSPAEEEGLHTMRSPIVGTFYRSPSPAAEPYVKVGDHVKQGQVLCIVEAMKLMNEIEGEVSGTLLEAMLEDGQPVEYGEPIFKIRPDR